MNSAVFRHNTVLHACFEPSVMFRHSTVLHACSAPMWTRRMLCWKYAEQRCTTCDCRGRNNAFQININIINQKTFYVLADIWVGRCTLRKVSMRTMLLQCWMHQYIRSDDCCIISMYRRCIHQGHQTYINAILQVCVYCVWTNNIMRPLVNALYQPTCTMYYLVCKCL